MNVLRIMCLLTSLCNLIEVKGKNAHTSHHSRLHVINAVAKTIVVYYNVLNYVERFTAKPV